VPDLWNYQTAQKAAASWSKLVDHVLCSLPFEPAVLHAAGVPSTFVGHPLLQRLLGSSSSTSSIGGKARLLTQLLKQQGGSPLQQQQRQQQGPAGSLFAAGNAAAFWRLYDATYAAQQQAAAAEAQAQDSNSSSSSGSNDNSSEAAGQPRQGTKRKAPAASQHQQQQGQQQQHGRMLLALLPGTTESEVVSSMAAFDLVTQQLQQQFPDLLVTLHVPEALVQPAVLATVNFAVPVLVVVAGERRAADALAASAAAVCHPGSASLQAAAAGVPLVCVRDGSLLKHAWGKWRQRQLLPFSSIPNLIAGQEAVVEANLWEKQGLERVVGVLRQLLQAHSESHAGSAAGRQQQQQQQLLLQHRAALQQVLLGLVPQSPQQQAVGTSSSRSADSGSKGSGSNAWQLPAEAAARTLLDLIALRQQHEVQQRSGTTTSSSSSSTSSSTSTSTSSSRSEAHSRARSRTGNGSVAVA
jgi:lipid A disaccharide synthetase